jgi:hypothetical protein
VKISTKILIGLADLPRHPEAAVSPADIEVLRGFFATNPAD